MKWLKRYPFTTIIFVISFVLYLCARFLNFDLFESLFKLLDTLEKLDMDGVLVVLFTLLALLVDLAFENERHSQLVTVQAQKLQVLKATMRTVQDLVGNFLNNLQLFRMEAEDGLSAESLAAFDELVQETASKLKTMGDLEEVHEKEGATGKMIDYEIK